MVPGDGRCRCGRESRRRGWPHGPRTEPAGFGAQQWSGGAHPAERGPVLGRRCARRAGSATRLAFSGSTLYVAESDQIEPTTTPTAQRQSPHHGGRVARCQESRSARRVFTRTEKRRCRPGWALYFSIGSTGNSPPTTAAQIRPRHHHADPAGRRFGYAVRDRRGNGTGLAIGPDGSVWTAVNDPRRTSLTRRLARSTPTMSTTIRPRHSPG